MHRTLVTDWLTYVQNILQPSFVDSFNVVGSRHLPTMPVPYSPALHVHNVIHVQRSIFILKYKLLCPRGTQTCALAVANIAHVVYLLDVAKRPIPQG